MHKFWSFPKHYFNNLVKKSQRGKAKTDESGFSVRQRAFRYFDQGLRPSKLPDLGVPMTTIYRYFESWKHRGEDFQFRLLKRLLKSETASREKIARLIGVSEQALMEALKDSRSMTQLKQKLMLEESRQLEQFMEQARQLDLERDIEELRHCSSIEERKAKFHEVVNRMGVGEEELILALKDEGKRLSAMSNKSG